MMDQFQSYGCYDLFIIQGDNFNSNVLIDGLSDTRIIQKIVFSSKKFNLKEELIEEDDGTYTLIIPSEKTKNLEVGVGDYDLTVIFFDNSIQTVVYRGKLCILEKVNKYEM